MRSQARSRFSQLVRRSATLESLERRLQLSFTLGDTPSLAGPTTMVQLESLLHADDHDHDHDHELADDDCGCTTCAGHDEYYPGGEDSGGGD